MSVSANFQAKIGEYILLEVKGRTEANKAQVFQLSIEDEGLFDVMDDFPSLDQLKTLHHRLGMFLQHFEDSPPCSSLASLVPAGTGKPTDSQ